MNINESVRIHLASLKAGHANFDDTLGLINQHFEFRPTGFDNGPVRNDAGENAGSCRVFALGQYCNLNEADTLTLFAQHYQQVLGDPAGDSHGNIRQFISTGWSGIHFDTPPLRALCDTQATDTGENVHP
ncbi:HopJ type III effector protein [Marinobacter daepoensis]|uniref:HopJ type III effector protein n=1 Tax=Marinobacter daepoensis TaxID=262077 RepID=A0ABS3BKU4_9GAMM|nr:HopJ type III effector protein [Marinobacter daepoensis]MBN7771471.1 HopJ type III effector protein [Marinobacter daepoensis]MBY6034258.1 HopJ type III effector protein [Marinobacter daepoensis]MBY6080072.1 HopJ type III effector protein [Marinobacter daepoensis]